MISDVILFVTLMLNAGAVLNFNLKQNRDEIFIEKPSLGDKIREFLSTVQYLRAFIGIWNIFVMFLMLVFFGS
uniref:Putative conserved plasma membrane protein n=1 Tax=Ornithodoros turicata TaxID=34597 RepID=A0A2R5L9K0_9ACAR